MTSRGDAPDARDWAGIVCRVEGPAELSAHLQHYAKIVTDALAFMPGWVAAPVLVAIIALLARRAIRQVTAADPPTSDVDAPDHPSHTGAEGDSSAPASQREYVRSR